MGLIREPKGVDFVVQSKPLTSKERADLSEYIRELKQKRKSKNRRRLIKQKSE